MARKNAIVSVELENGNPIFTVAGEGSFSLDLSNLSDEIRNRAMLHGIVQKISDGAALGKDATPGDKFVNMKAIADRLADGDWSKSRGEGAGPVAGIIFRAFREYVEIMAAKRKKPIPSEAEIRAVYDAKDRAGQLALRTVPEIAEIIGRMKSERGPKASAIDAETLLADLGI